MLQLSRMAAARMKIIFREIKMRQKNLVVTWIYRERSVRDDSVFSVQCDGRVVVPFRNTGHTARGPGWFCFGRQKYMQFVVGVC